MLSDPVKQKKGNTKVQVINGIPEEPTAHTHKHLHDAQEPAAYFEITEGDYNKYEKQVLNKTLDPWWEELPKSDLSNFHLHERAVMNSVCSL